LESEQIEIEKLKSDLESIQKDIGSKNEHLQSLLTEQRSSDDKREILTYVHMALSKSGFIGHIFDSILEELNDQINRNLQLVPLTSCFQLYFNSDKIAKTTGNVSKTITYTLVDEGKEISFGTLSGAEKLIVIGSVEEAIADVLSSRLGIQIGWKFLDEQFAWIDSQNKELVLDFYRQKSQDRTYFIVDHASELNAGIENRIVIVKQNKIARIQQ
jgi:DNA repair exonuclease SbcCD ATPase subunit